MTTNLVKYSIKQNAADYFCVDYFCVDKNVMISNDVKSRINVKHDKYQNEIFNRELHIQCH